MIISVLPKSSDYKNNNLAEIIDDFLDIINEDNDNSESVYESVGKSMVFDGKMLFKEKEEVSLEITLQTSVFS